MHPCRNMWCNGEAFEPGHLCTACWRSERHTEDAMKAATRRARKHAQQKEEAK